MIEIYLKLNGCDPDLVASRLKRVSGLNFFSFVKPS